MRRIVLAVVAVLALAAAAPAVAQDGVTLSGSATVDKNTIKFVSDTSDTNATNDWGNAKFAVPAGTTFGSLSKLSAEFNVTDDDCGGGSPRFQIEIGGKNVFVYLGPSPTFTGCAKSPWIDSGNLVGTSDACRVDTSQFAPGTQCSTWAAATALLGSQTVASIQIAVDGGWSQSDKEQTVLLRRVTINNQTFRFGSEGGGGGGGGAANPAKLCKEQRTKSSSTAFNELWGTNANDRNAFGKCVSVMAHARNAGKTQDQILSSIDSCVAKGLRGAALGACVAANDGVSATKTEAQERAVKNKKAKGRKHGRR